LNEAEVLLALASGQLPDEQSLDSLFQSIADSYSFVALRLSKQLKLDELRDAFRNADVECKGRVIMSLVAIANAFTNMIDISALGGSRYAGCMKPTFSKEMSQARGGFAFIDQSVTGMFERRQPLEL
jgi:CRISPR-associated endonuclease Csn1